MASKSGTQTTIDSIFLASMDLFRENGYIGTSIRQIAERAGVSLGLVNHYFGSKQELGVSVLETLMKYAVINVTNTRQEEADLLFLDALETRVVNLYLYHGPFRQFYLDSLEKDLFFSCLEKQQGVFLGYLSSEHVALLELLQETYHYTVTKDMVLLYSRYIPYMVEKTLVLKKRQGLFSGISEEEIPYQIFQSSYSGRIPQDILIDADRRARLAASDLVAQLPPYPDRETLERFSLLPLQLSWQ